jgi:hypothetical protein
MSFLFAVAAFAGGIYVGHKYWPQVAYLGQLVKGLFAKKA